MPREVPKIGSGAVLGSGESPWVHKLPSREVYKGLHRGLL